MKILPWFLLGIAIMVILWRGCGDETVALDATRAERDSLRVVASSNLSAYNSANTELIDLRQRHADTVELLNRVRDTINGKLRFANTRITNLIAQVQADATRRNDTTLLRQIREGLVLRSEKDAHIADLETNDRVKDSLCAVEITHATQITDRKDSLYMEQGKLLQAALLNGDKVQAIADKLNKQAGKRWGLGLYGGYGLTKEGLRPSVGISIQFAIIKL